MLPTRARLIAVLSVVLAATGLVATPAVAQPRPSPVARATVAAVVDRLDVMPAVAYTKYRKSLPIVDPAREAQAEEAFVAAATARGIGSGLARRVILAQFAAAKHVQRRLIRDWTNDIRRVPHHAPADLALDLRPRIDAATTALLDALVRWAQVTPASSLRQALGQAQARAAGALRPALAQRDLATALEPWRPAWGLG